MTLVCSQAEDRPCPERGLERGCLAGSRTSQQASPQKKGGTVDGGLRAPTPYRGGMTQRTFFLYLHKDQAAVCILQKKKKVPHNIIWFDCPSYAMRQLSEVEQLI